jgi:hypothetical protein
LVLFSTFMANLNVFIMSWIAAWFVLGGPLQMMLTLPVMWAARRFFNDPMAGIMPLFIAPIVIIGVALAVVWALYGLSPVPRPDRRRRYRIGHAAVATFNLMLLAAASAPRVLSAITRDPGAAVLLWYFIPVLALGFLVGLIGLALILSSSS